MKPSLSSLFPLRAASEAALCAQLRGLAKEIGGGDLHNKEIHEAAALVDWLGIFRSELRFPLEVGRSEAPDFLVQMGEEEIGLEITRLTNPHVQHVRAMQKAGRVPPGSFWTPGKRPSKEDAENLVTGRGPRKELWRKLGIGGWTFGPKPGLRSFTKAVKNIVDAKSGKLARGFHARPHRTDVLISYEMAMGARFQGFDLQDKIGKHGNFHREGLMNWFRNDLIDCIRKRAAIRRVVIVGFTGHAEGKFWPYFIGNAWTGEAEFGKLSDPFGTESYMS